MSCRRVSTGHQLQTVQQQLWACDAAVRQTLSVRCRPALALTVSYGSRCCRIQPWEWDALGDRLSGTASLIIRSAMTTQWLCCASRVEFTRCNEWTNGQVRKPPVCRICVSVICVLPYRIRSERSELRVARGLHIIKCSAHSEMALMFRLMFRGVSASGF